MNVINFLKKRGMLEIHERLLVFVEEFKIYLMIISRIMKLKPNG